MEQHINTLLALDFTDKASQASQFRDPLMLARSIAKDLDSSASIKPSIDKQLLLQLLVVVQRLAYATPDRGHDAALAAWCEREYAYLLQRSDNEIECHVGLGRSWLLKAQPSLARIEANEHESSHPSSIPGVTNTQRASSGHDDEHERVDSADYVEARDMLRASIEHLDRALTASAKANKFRGETLERAAEAYMNLGNVNSSRINERYYQRALHLLQKANTLQGFEMDEHLEEFFDQNSDYITDVKPWY